MQWMQEEKGNNGWSLSLGLVLCIFCDFSFLAGGLESKDT